ITTNSNQYQYTTESAASTDEWVKVLSHALKSASIAELDGQTPLLGAAVRGWLTKVKYGHSKRFFAALVGTKLMLFKTPGAKIPTAQLYVKGAHIAEVVRSSDESGNSDGDHNVDTTDKNPSEADYSVSIQMPNEDPIYLVFVCREEKDKWLYYLRLASKDGELYGTPFEVLVQRLMAADGVPGCDLWKDLLITCCEENPKEALTTISEESKRKEAISLAKACYLFTSVLMRSTGVQYHIDLAQNTLQMAMATDNVRNELFAQLIKLTNGAMPYGLQAWKLLGLAVSLFTPSQYALLWLLRKHLERWSCMGGEEANMAKYCLQALQRCQRNGGRKEAPSKLETTSLLTRNPCTTKLPHSITIRTPSGEYQVIEFDGSSLVGECLTTVCAKLSIRQPLLCGYALYSDDPSQVDTENALSPRHKICDAISRWERQLKDCRSGRISDSRTIRLQLRPRYYWPHLSVSETEAERVFLAYRMADELKHGHVPVSPELAEELSALLAQMHYGDSPSTLDADRFEQIVCSFYPSKLLEVACKRTLKSKLLDHWQDLKGSSMQDCARVILGVLRRWRLFGAHLYVAGMRWKNDEKIFIAVNDAGVHLLTSNNLDLINTYPYQLLVNFGGYHDDFMLTVSREVANRNNPEEPSKERLTFSMAKPAILQLTLHIADYIKTRKMVWHASKERNLQSPARRTPRKSPQRAKARKM
uniref:Uncharacterized protein n=1 Tax=Plectus sambesii TaxID=2011161 RepID=A0A914WZ88_9BILA